MVCPKFSLHNHCYMLSKNFESNTVLQKIKMSLRSKSVTEACSVTMTLYLDNMPL